MLLLEKLAVVVALTATRRLGGPAQVLAAQCVVFVSLMLQLKAQPYGCRMLDVLQVGGRRPWGGPTRKPA